MKKHLLGYVLLLGLLISNPLRAFISPDPEGHVASMDLYSYCNGDPVNQYDADGRIGKGAATGVALGGFGQYENTTQQIAGLVGQVGSYFIPGMQGYSTARDITFSGYSASKAAYNLAQPKGFNLSNGSELLFSAAGLIPGVGGVGSALRGESSAVFQEFRQTISLGAEKTIPEGPLINPSAINFSQRSVSSNIAQYADAMANGAWDWSKSGPLRVMEKDGGWVSFDNRRLMAAQQAGLDSVPVEIVGGAKWEKAFQLRFADPRNISAGGVVPNGGLSSQPFVLHPKKP